MVEILRQVGGEIPVQRRPQLTRTRNEAPGELHRMLMDTYEADLREPEHRSPQPGDPMPVECACLEMLRIGLRLPLVKRANPGTAANHSTHLDAWGHCKPTCPLRPHQSLVPCESQKVDTQR